MLVAKGTLKPDIGPASIAPAYVSDISLLGVGFHTPASVSIGSRYQIRLEVGPMKWNSRVRVITCIQHENGTFGVGAEFVGNELAVPARKAA